jgi:KDO2-lipid IV(A) lauroyltransferase
MLLALFRLLSHLPLRSLHMLGHALGRLVYAMPGKYRERLQSNARQAGYDSPAFFRQAAGQAGAMILELAWVWFKPAQSLARLQSPEECILDQARQERRGILFLTPHLGSFELSARHGAHEHPLTVMFRPPRKAILAPVLEVARNASGVTAVPASRQGVRAFLKALRDRQAVGMLPDQVPREGDGVWAPFFGVPAWTVTLPGKLASMTGAIVILAACERLPRGQGWRMHYLRAPEPLPEDPTEQARVFNELMQSLIQRFPQQYLWGYHRYKRPKHAPDPPKEAS